MDNFTFIKYEQRREALRCMLQFPGGPGTFAIMVLITVVGGVFYWQSSRVA